MDALLQELLPFSGDHDEIVKWDNFTNPSKNILQRFFFRMEPGDHKFSGFTYKNFQGLLLSDLTDIPHVGELRCQQVISELRSVFKRMENGSLIPLLIGDLINYDGDANALIAWENLTTPVCNILQRYMLTGPNMVERNLAGFCYRDVEGIAVSDLAKILYVGEMRKQQVIDELSDAFEKLANNEIPFLDNVFDELDSEEIDYVDEAKTVSDLVVAIIGIYSSYRELDDRSIDILLARIPALLEGKKTLDELGREYKVTRERIRQIERYYVDLQLDLEKSENQLLNSLVVILENSKNENEFSAAVESEGLLGDSILTIEKLKALLEIVGVRDYLARVENVVSSWVQNSKTLNSLADRVRNYRSKFGLLEISIFAQDQNVSEREAFEAISAAYPRSIRVENLVLARTDRFDSAFESVIGKQLIVFHSLDVEEIFVGIERHSNYRNSPLAGTHSELIKLIKIIAGENPNYETFQKNTLEETLLSATDKWFIEIFQSASSGYLHRNEIINAAIQEGKNTSSISVYLLFHPLLRAVGSGVFTLANLKPNIDEVRRYAEVAKSTEDPTNLSFEFSGTRIVLNFVPNLNTISAGVLFPDSNLRSMVKDFTFDVYCECGNLESLQQLRLRPPSFWTGFTAAIKHLFTFHHYSRGENIRISLDFEEVKAKILIDS